MDWLSKNRAIIECYSEKIKLNSPSGNSVQYQKCTPRINNSPSVIMGVDASDIVKDVENEVFGSEGRDVVEKIHNIPIVREFPCVFSKYLLGLPPKRIVDFHID